ncbi:MAG: hypothetical protein IJU27_02995 [Bacteroidales bacterium]|nr:hypothetical protein [Bacteroidales bacterium]
MYVQVILPLRLGWSPTYDAGDLQLTAGERVRVKLAGREYVGVVAATDVKPDIDPRRILPVISKESALEAILPSELEFWDFIASYYMCTPGEVYKYVYPVSRTKTEEKKARSPKGPAATNLIQQPRLDATAKKAVTAILASFDEAKPALLVSGATSLGAGSARSAGSSPEPEGKGQARSAAIEAELVLRSLAQDRDVLIIDPAAPRESYVTMRNAAARARSQSSPAEVYEGSKALLFLPFTRLGLIIIREEQSEKHKQTALAPRFNARDAALMLARQRGADVLLTSRFPSLESIWNCKSGKFSLVDLPALQRYPAPSAPAATASSAPSSPAGQNRLAATSAPATTASSAPSSPAGQNRPAATSAPAATELIDTSAEFRKNGMSGSFSRKLLAAMADAFSRKEHVALIVPWKNGDDIEIEAREHFPAARTLLAVMPLHDIKKPEKYALAALMRAEYLLDKPDFRCDEKALRAIHELEEAFPRLIVQASDAGYKVLSAPGMDEILAERRQFGYPPFTRIVDITFSDSNEARLAKLSGELSRKLGTPVLGGRIRIILKRDRSLAERKKEILRIVEDFESAGKYYSHIKIDVDPV